MWIQGDAGDIESEWTMFKASIIEAVAKSCGQKVKGACRSSNLTNLTNPLVDTSGEGCHQTEGGGSFWGIWVVSWSYGDCEERLSVGIKEVLVNCSAVQEEKAGLTVVVELLLFYVERSQLRGFGYLIIKTSSRHDQSVHLEFPVGIIYPEWPGNISESPKRNWKVLLGRWNKMPCLSCCNQDASTGEQKKFFLYI